MGLDLTFLPFYGGNADFAHTALDCVREADLFDAVDAIAKEKGRDVPDVFESPVSRHKGKPTHYGPTTKDAYGDPMKYVTAGDLRALKSKPNRAALAYLKALPKAAKVAIYWH